MIIDKQNGTVAFNTELHRYWDVNDNDKKFISVTTLIEKFGQPFNKEFWSAYKALEKLLPKDVWNIEKKTLLNTKRFDKELLAAYNIEENDFNRAQQEILDMWQEENRKSCERGTQIHAQLEEEFYKAGSNNQLTKFGIGGKFDCKKDYSDLDIPYGIYPEYLIYYNSPDGQLNLAGQIDCLVKNGDEYNILDWKTNKEIKLKGFFDSKSKSSSKMKYPLNTLEECNFNHYQLQLSTYAWMIQKLIPNAKIGRLIIYHFDHNGKETQYECQYLKREVELMLAWYKKELKKEEQRAKLKPIEY